MNFSFVFSGGSLDSGRMIRHVTSFEDSEVCNSAFGCWCMKVVRCEFFCQFLISGVFDRFHMKILNQRNLKRKIRRKTKTRK